MTPAAFAYARPDTLEHALALLATAGAVPLAGGHSLVPMLMERSQTPALLVDLSRLGDLRRIERVPGGTQVGAAVRLSELASSPLAGPRSLLAEAVASVGSPAIRNRATLVGNLVRASPTGELPVAVLALGARFVLRRPGARRELPADAFFVAPYRTAVAPGEIVTGVILPEHDPARTAGAFAEVALRAGAPPLACVAAWIGTDAAGTIRAARLVAGGITGVPARCYRAEGALLGNGLGAAARVVAAAAAEAHVPSADVENAAYAADVLPVLLRRAVATAAARLAGAAAPGA